MRPFDKVIGYEKVKEELIQICDILKNKEVYETLGARMPSGVLLYGEAGRIRNVLLDNVSVSLVETSRWPKHCYDLRPGATVEGLMHRVAVPVFAHGVTGLRLRSLSTQGMGSACANGAEDVALEDCSQVSREA